jgi:uncharacterized membrane protein
MPAGLLLLFILAAVVFFGFAQRVLDRMRLTDTQALIIIALVIVGSFFDIPLFGGHAINVGGGLIPLGLLVYVWLQADTAKERVRSLAAAFLTGLAVVLVGSLWSGGPHGGSFNLIDPLWLYAITAGIIGYLSGRSRRASFIAGVGGLILADIYEIIRGSTTVSIGGAGALDQIVLAGVIAVGLAEFVGEARESMQGGPRETEDTPLALKIDEGVAENEDASKEGGKQDE